jgi:hypothetical protein
MNTDQYFNFKMNKEDLAELERVQKEMNKQQKASVQKSSSRYDYLDALSNVKKETTDSVLIEISTQCLKLKVLRKHLEDIEKEESELKKEELELSRRIIPELLQKNGIDSIRLISGEVVEIREDLSVTIPKEDYLKRKQAFQYIESLEGGKDIIKEKLTIDDYTDEIKSILQSKNVAFSENKDIHYQTLKSFFKDMLGMKKNTPAKIEFSNVPDCLIVYRYKETKFK